MNRIAKLMSRLIILTHPDTLVLGGQENHGLKTKNGRVGPA